MPIDEKTLLEYNKTFAKMINHLFDEAASRDDIDTMRELNDIFATWNDVMAKAIMNEE